MVPPPRMWFVEWQEHFRGGRIEERRYRSKRRAARQVAAILAPPDEVVELRGVWRTDGWDTDRLHWTRLDPHDLIAEVDAEHEGDSVYESDPTLTEWLHTITAAWVAYTDREEAQDRPEGGRPGSTHAPGTGVSGSPPVHRAGSPAPLPDVPTEVH